MMAAELKYTTLANSEDVKRLGEILNQCFISSSGESEGYINKVGVENIRVVHHDGQVVGGLAILSMAQWFGGVNVPMAGIAGVGIAPEYRGVGAAINMMEQTLKEVHSKGVPISALYPATQKLYRKAGYEQGGNFCGWEIPTAHIQIKEQPLPVSRVSLSPEIFYALYNQQAKYKNGYLDRNPFIWQRVLEPDENEVVYAYLIGSANQPQGYIIFTQHRIEEGSILRIKDWVVLTTAAAQTFWSFLSTKRSQIEKVRWRGSVTDPLMLLLPEQAAKIKFLERWMLRIVDVVKALEKRGYPPGVAAELHLEIQDELLAANNGKFILSVTDGRGEVKSGGKGELKLDIRGLAPLYTGLFTPQQLQLAGKLEATETALTAATQIFMGTTPGMPDFF